MQSVAVHPSGVTKVTHTSHHGAPSMSYHSHSLSGPSARIDPLTDQVNHATSESVSASNK